VEVHLYHGDLSLIGQNITFESILRSREDGCEENSKKVDYAEFIGHLVEFLDISQLRLNLDDGTSI
jgi:hypothetical protein